MIASNLPYPGPQAGQLALALRHKLALVVSQCEVAAARVEGGLAPAGTFDDLIAMIDAASAAITAVQDAP